jgi:type IV pilus assembly protein PilW
MRHTKKIQSGFSLIEIMVALVISLFLLGGIIQVFIGNKVTYRFSDASARVQENGRFSLDIIASDIRMAGFMGCYSLQDDDNNDGNLSDDNPYLFNQLNFTAGAIFDFVDEPSVDATNTAGSWTAANADTLTIRGAQPSQNTITTNLSPLTNPVVVGANNTFQTGDIAMITNCFSANIFQITSVSTDRTTLGHTAAAGTPGNANASFSTSIPVSIYNANSASVFSLQEVTYSIGTSASGSGEPALFRSVNGIDQELIEGIENFQLLFGVDTDGDGSANQYLESDNAAVNLAQVTAIRLWLVVRSDQDFIVDEIQSYSINGNNITPTDRRFRQVYSATIALRSKSG